MDAKSLIKPLAVGLCSFAVGVLPVISAGQVVWFDPDASVLFGSARLLSIQETGGTATLEPATASVGAGARRRSPDSLARGYLRNSATKS